MMDTTESGNETERPTRQPLRWLGNTIRRQGLSMCLSVALHAFAVCVVAVVLLQINRGRPEQPAGEISVSLIASAEPAGAPSSGSPGREGGGQDGQPADPSMADQAEQSLLQEQEAALRDVAEIVEKAADKAAWSEAEKAIQQAEAAYQRRRAKRAGEVARQLGDSAKRWSDLDSELAGLKAKAKEWNAGSFYGIRTGKARRIAYVIDRSSSMQGKFHSVIQELRRAIDSMTEGKSFHIILYSSGPLLEMPACIVTRQSVTCGAR